MGHCRTHIYHDKYLHIRGFKCPFQKEYTIHLKNKTATTTTIFHSEDDQNYSQLRKNVVLRNLFSSTRVSLAAVTRIGMCMYGIPVHKGNSERA